MSDPIYRLGDDHYCANCVVPALLDRSPFALWAAVNEFEPGEDAEGDLDFIAEEMGVLPTTWEANGMPVKVAEPPEPPTFCPGCLNFFSLPTNNDTEEYL